MNPSVTIVILSWNGKEDCLRCLSSLQELPPPHPHIIVVDNGSTDGTAEAVENQFPAVEVLSLTKNLGFSGGANRGIKRALQSGFRYICLLNNDTIVSPNFLDELLQAAASHPRAGILGARIYFSDRPEQVWSQGISVQRWSGRVHTNFHDRPESEVSNKIGEVDAVSAAALLLRREVVEEVGLFDGRYFLCYEDIDLCLRARRKGFQIITVPAARVWHRVSASMGGEGSATIIYYSTRNQLLAVNHCLPLPVILRWFRNLLIIAFNFLFVVITSPTPRREGLESWGRGVRDYFRKRWGEMTPSPKA